MRKQFAVIGLGYFGQTIALELSRLGHDVLAIDTEAKLIDDIAGQVTHAVIADASDEEVLRGLNIMQYDAAIIAIGHNIEASLLCTLNLKALGVRQVWVKAVSEQHHKLLSKIGANKIIHPELEMGVRVAQLLNYPLVQNYFDLGNHHYLIEMAAPSNLHNKSIKTWLDENGSTGTVLSIKRNDTLHNHPDANFSLQADDQLVLIGSLTELRKLTALS